MVTKAVAKWFVGASACGLALVAMAAPFSVTYTDTVLSATGPLAAEIANGQQVTVQLILDNGNGTAANQTWSASHLQCVIFTFNNAQDRFVAIDYSGGPLSGAGTTTTGSFTTNGAGQLQAGTFEWDDLRDPIPNPHLTNIAGVTTVNFFYIDGFNDVIFFNAGQQVGFTNVANNDQVANWSNPVASDGVCAGSGALPPPPASSQPIPTLTEWGLVILSGLLTLGAAFFLRRQRR
jgi:hypothetical protein